MSRLKLLFLSYYFPPGGEIACVRSWNIAKYLARLGWEVTVVTPDTSVLRHVEGGQRVAEQLMREGIGRILTGHRWPGLSPKYLSCWNESLGWLAGGACRRLAGYLGIEREIGWLEPARQACSTLTSDDVDVILATGSPFVGFTLARWLSDKLLRPYVLDYRDLWSRNSDAHALKLSATLTMRKEATLLAGCAAATIVSRSCASAMTQRFDLENKPYVITNGYDPEELIDVPPYHFGHFAIVYTGSFYPPKRVISPVMVALKRLKETTDRCHDEWYFHYYGDGDGEMHVREEAHRVGVMDRVVLHGMVSRAEALSAVRGAGVAVVITSIFEQASPEDKGIVTGKVFEPLGLGTRILLIAPAGSDARDILEDTGMGRSFVGTDVDGITAFLSNMARTDKKRSKRADQYSWPHLAAKLDSILKNVVASQKSGRTAPNDRSNATCVG